METFYSDKDKLFKCKVEIEGASIEDSYARLLLDFGDGECFLFKGTIDESGNCRIKVPALKHAFADKGKSILEIIVDSALFESWDSEFIIKRSKSVKVKVQEEEEVEHKPKIKVLKEEAEPEPMEESFKTYYSKFINEQQDKSKDFKTYKPSFNAMKFLKEKKQDLNNPISKIFMYYLDQKVL